MSDTNVCGGGPRLIFACSGAADVGEVTDLAARSMSKQGAGSMFCLAGIGGRVKPILEKTASASSILAIDGCPLNCVAETLKQAGFERFEHLVVTELGLEKGRTPVDAVSVEAVVKKGCEILNGESA